MFGITEHVISVCSFNYFSIRVVSVLCYNNYLPQKTIHETFFKDKTTKIKKNIGSLICQLVFYCRNITTKCAHMLYDIYIQSSFFDSFCSGVRFGKRHRCSFTRIKSRYWTFTGMGY